MLGLLPLGRTLLDSFRDTVLTGLSCTGHFRVVPTYRAELPVNGSDFFPFQSAGRKDLPTSLRVVLTFKGNRCDFFCKCWVVSNGVIIFIS